MSDGFEAGRRMYRFAEKIFPYTRSITGEGVRQTLSDIEEYIASSGTKLKISDIPSGTQVFDWTVPKEWKIREAYIEDENGDHIIDMKESNLHVLGYSTPVDEWVDLDELKRHIYVEENQPDVIPYVTSYYKERFGFCMSKNKLDSLKDGRYHMYIDSELFDGVLNYAEAIIPGDSDEEIMFSTYFCHPSMADNECSGPALAAELINTIASMGHRRYTYRFVFVPETIGSITYLSQNDHVAYLQKHLKAGFVLSCVGDDNDYSMIHSRYADTYADRVLLNVLSYKEKHTFYGFNKRGSDERQYNAPGVDLPVVCFCRSKFGEFAEYHTSADNMDFVSKEGFQGAYDAMMEAVNILEKNARYRMKVLCEPQLGKRGLYSDISRKGIYDTILVQRDVISYCDGKNDLLDLSERIGVPVSDIIDIIERLKENDLLEETKE
ncbi:MAG: DUF4910 domain-containing protein [Lachnospiraceae bacterium]|nr:DUF4910 domain-containing protein [Lachnospiraceae bacterium]